MTFPHFLQIKNHKLIISNQFINKDILKSLCDYIQAQTELLELKTILMERKVDIYDDNQYLEL